MSPSRVKVKVYGLVSLTKRAYLTIQITGAVIGLVAITLALLWPRPKAVPGHPLPPFVSGVHLFLDLFPWIGLLVLILVALETHIVLGKFRREEERQSQGSGVRGQESERTEPNALPPSPQPPTPDP